MIGDWSHDFAYLEGSFSFGGEFLGFISYLQVLAIKPYLLTLFKESKLSYRSFCHPLSGQFCCGSLVSGFFEGLQPVFCCECIGVLECQGDVFGFVSHHEVEQ